MMASFFQMNTASTLGSGTLPSNTIANPKGDLKAITTRSGLVLDRPSIPMHPPFINPEEDEYIDETLTEPELDEFTIKVPPPLRPGKFLIPCGFSKIKCKALADLGASINLMPLSVWKKLGLPKLISTHMTLELANQAICTPTRIARDVFVPVGKFTFPADFVILDYESDPRVPLILGRLFLRTARALIDVHGEEMILRDGDERLTLNIRHDTSSYSNQPQKESINMINIYDDSCEDYLKDLFATNHPSGNPTFSSHPDLTSLKVKDDIFDLEGDVVLIEKFLNLDSTKDLLLPHNINPLSSITTSSSPDHLLKEFADELALITFPPGNDDLPFDIESNLREIEYSLNHDPTKEMDSILEDSVDEGNLTDPNDNLFDTISEIFIDKHAFDYSSPSLYDDLDELESNYDAAYNDPFDSKEDKIKESNLLIVELDPPRSSNSLVWGILVMDIQKKDKIEAKTDKTEHEMEKRKKSKSNKSKSTKVKVKDRAETEEMLNGPTHTHLMGQVTSTTPEGVDLILLGDLSTMFEANAEDELWQNQEEWNLKSWNFYENCGVHILILEDGTEIHMLAERRYPLTTRTLERMLSLRLIAESASDVVYDLLRFIQKQIDESGRNDRGENKELASPKQTTLGNDILNPLIVNSLLNTIWLSIHHVIAMKHWLFQSKRLLLAILLNRLRKIHSKGLTKMLIDNVVNAAQVTTAIADILVSIAETIVTTTPTITAESTKTNVEANVDADYELAERLQIEEQEQLKNTEKAKLFMKFIEKRRKFFAAKRTIEKWNKPPTKA
nr:reverse transcriptase domain-containing protein [Tanacetum cinerariifolium]